MINAFQKLMKQNKLDFCIFLNSSLTKQDPNIFYFTEIHTEYSILVVPQNKKPFFLIPGFEYERIKKHSKIKVVKLKKTNLGHQIKKHVKKSKNIGINKDILSLNEFSRLKKQFKKSKFKDISLLMKQQRSIKTKKEIKIIKKSCNIAASILSKTIKKMNHSLSEQQITNFLIEETKNQGCELAFPPIVASGSNASFPHHIPTSNKLKKGFCIIDFGVKYKGYCSDITRTLYIGKPSNKEIETYNQVLATQLDAINQSKIGNKTKSLFNSVSKVLGKEFTHGLGHGIGIEIHEYPNLTPISKDIIQENMVYTIEPGIYTKKLGIRIEDDVLITKKSPIILTKLTKKLILI
tara:strand:- start:4178 stop:5227 length:1050 start_codon:yes stop_codon:yes gene_type:complete